MDRPPADPVALLSAWMEWEGGESTPGQVMATLKKHGLREILEREVAAADQAASGSSAG